MALADLASDSDLSDRGIAPTSVNAVMLTVASSLVRQAAGSPILETDSTVVLTGWTSDVWLSLPGIPVTAVDSVSMAGTTVTDWRLSESKLWRPCGWSKDCGPCDVEVSMTHGLATVPAHIVQLVCDLAILGEKSAADGAHDPNVLVERIDDYSVTFSAAGAQVASAMTIPRATIQSLKSQFGGGVAKVVYR